MTPEEYEIESFRQSSVFSIFPLLRTGIFHRTSIDGYKGIRDSGYVIANQGQFPYSYPQSKFYYGHSMGYVSLFDFESATEEDCISIHHTWAKFFSDQKPVTIVLKLNREKLGSDLIPNSAPPRLGSEGYKGYIPYIEVWYPKPIPASAIDSFFITILNRESGELMVEEFAEGRITEFEETVTAIEYMWLDALQEIKRGR